MEVKSIYERITSLVRLKAVEARVTRSIRTGETKLPYAPSSLNLLMVDKCNSCCIMCGHDYKNCGSSDALTLEKIKMIYDKLDMKQLVEVIYGGGGEPFLNSELADIASFTRKQCPAVQHTVISNMIASPNDKVILSLLKNRVHFLVSVNAASRKVFEQVAGIDAFENVVANVKRLVSLRKKTGSKVGISISIILMKQNIGELPNFILLAKDMGVDGVKAVYVRIYPEKYRRKSDGTVHISPSDSLFFHQEESDMAIQASEKVARQQGILFEHQPLFSCSEGKRRECREPWRSLYIGFNGELYPCAASEIMFMHKVGSGQYLSGNILQQSLEEIWNNSFWQALRKTNAGNRREEIVPECLCCGSSIDWDGVNVEGSHIMDWSKAEKSDLRI